MPAFTDLGVPPVVTHTMAVNQPSPRVIEKYGLALIRSCRSDDVPDIPGADQAEVEYALTPSDGRPPPPAPATFPPDCDRDRQAA